MKCPRCLRLNPDTAIRCQCGFPFDDVPQDELQDWFDEVKGILETAYMAATEPWKGSGKSGPFEEWTRLRLPNVGPVNEDGSYLDIGCANGYLLECLLAWTKLKGVEMVPYGLDYSIEMVKLTQQRLPAFATNIFHGNGFTWQPPRRFDYVRTEVVYVPANYRRTYIDRLLSDFLTENGKLLLSDYRGSSEDLSTGWLVDELVAWGYNVTETHDGYGGTGLKKCQVSVVQRGESV